MKPREVFAAIGLGGTLVWRVMRANFVWLARSFAECFGWAAILGLVIGPLVITWYERTTDVRRASAIPVSPVAAKIAAKLSPPLQRLAVEHQDEVVASAGNVLYRFAASKIYPVAVEAIPRATEIGCDKALSYLDSMPMSQVASLMIEHAKSSGCEVHYSTWMMAERHQ